MGNGAQTKLRHEKINMKKVTAEGGRNLNNNGNDNGHSFSQRPVHKALTCPQGRVLGSCSTPWLAKEIPSKQKILNNVFRSDLLPLEVKWSCICAGKEMCFTQDECVIRNPGCCIFGRVCLVWLL